MVVKLHSILIPISQTEKKKKFFMHYKQQWILIKPDAGTLRYMKYSKVRNS